MADRSAGSSRCASPRLAAAALVLAALLCAGLERPAAAALTSSDEHRVLLLLSSHEADPWTLAVIRGMSRVFDERELRLSLWVESLDSRRNRGRGYFADLLQLYRRKLSSAEFDVVIAAGDEALEFALEHRDTLTPGVPLVFAGVTRADPARLAASSGVTGIRESVDFRATLDAALALHPLTERIILLTPALDGRYLVEPLVADYRPDLDLEIWSDEGLEEVLERVAALPANTIVVPVGEPRLANGRKIRTDDFTRVIAERTDAPLYTVWDVALGHGIVGGQLVSPDHQGAAAARLALRVLDGEGADTIALERAEPGPFHFDYRELVRLGLSEERLPAGSIVSHRPASFYRTHRRVLLSAAAIIVSLAAFIGVLLRSIAVRRRAEVALRESEARFRDFLEHSPGAVSLTDLAGRFLLVNPTYESVLGVASGELAGRTAHEVFDQEFAAESTAQDEEVLARGASVSRELVIAAGQERRELLCVKFPVRDGSSSVVGIGSITVDVSDLKQAERALREREQRFREYAEEELERARKRLVRQTRLSAIGQVAASLAHDIRNPLGAIRNAAYFLSRRVPPGEPKWASYLELIEREVVASDRIISHMMEVVRERALERGEVDLETSIATVARRLEHQEGVRIEVDVSPSPFHVHADPAQLERVLDNLLANAAQAMDGRGTVLVRGRREADSDIIVVRDEGQGVPEEIIEQLFEPLVTTKARGTGLGLAICDQIIRQHGGQILYARAAGGGAEFRIELPVASGAAQDRVDVG